MPLCSSCRDGCCYFSQALSAQQYYHIIVSLGVTLSTSTHNTATTLEITAAVTSIIAFVVGAIVGILLYQCSSKYRSQLKPESSSHQSQEENQYKVSAISGEEKLELRDNVAYLPVRH